MRIAIFLIAGAIIMFVVLRILANNKNTQGTSQTTKNFMTLANTPQAYSLIKTNEFRELSKTPAFKNFVSTLAEEQINIMAKSLTGSIKTF